jgi:hypothetical protein
MRLRRLLVADGGRLCATGVPDIPLVFESLREVWLGVVDAASTGCLLPHLFDCLGECLA